MTTTAITGGRILDQNGERSGDVLVDDQLGQIVEVGPSLSGDNNLDATGCFVSPGFVDLHADLCQPGREAAETIESGSRAAALGGYTAVVAMPATDPCIDNAVVVADVLAATEGALCDVRPAAAISVGREGAELAPMGELSSLGVRMFSDHGRGVQDAGFMRRALQYAGSIATGDGAPLVLAQHCSDASLARKGVMHEGEWSSKLGLAGLPAEAEELMVMRDISLVRMTGVGVHFQQLSTAGSVAMVRAAKAGGLPVTAEVSPHHLTLTDQACATFDPRFRLDPPLRTASDVAAVREGLLDGTIDAIATDHAPHVPDAKERPFDQAPPGTIGLETTLGIALTELEIPLTDLLPLLSWQPAAIAGLAAEHGRPIDVGSPANVAVIDPEHRWTVRGTELASRASNSAFEGHTLTGKVRHTILHGSPVVRDFEAAR